MLRSSTNRTSGSHDLGVPQRHPNRRLAGHPEASRPVKHPIPGVAKTLTYSVVLPLEPDESAINVVVPALPGVLTWDATIDEDLAAAQEAIARHLEGYAERGQPFPLDRKPRGESVQIDVVEFTVDTRRSA